MIAHLGRCLGNLGRHGPACALGAVALTLACTTSNAIDMHASSSQTFTGSALYFGRFVADAPPGMRVSSEEAEVQDVEVSEVEWTEGTAGGPASDRPPGVAAARSWAARLAVLRADVTKHPANAPDVIIAERRLAPDLRLLYRHDGRVNPSLVAAEALLDAGPGGMWLRAPYRPGSEAEVIDVFTTLARSYRVYPSAGIRDVRAPAFHLAHGALYVPFAVQENLLMGVDGSASGLKNFTIATQTGADPEWGSGLVAEWRAKLANPVVSAAFNVGGSLVRARARTVGGLAGEEVVARLATAARAPELVLAWAYRGEDDAPTRPRIKLSAGVVAGRDAQALAAWDHLLDTWRPVGQDDASTAAPSTAAPRSAP